LFLLKKHNVRFSVGILTYFYNVFFGGSKEANRSALFATGTSMAGWIIAHGVVRAPKILRATNKAIAEIAGLARKWVGGLTRFPPGLAVAVAASWLCGQRPERGGAEA